MKHKQLRILLSLALLTAIVFSMLLPCTAAKPEKEEKKEEKVVRILQIHNEKQFLKFAEDCRLDANSQDLEVQLYADLNLAGFDFQGIPLFLGSFQGNGHTISGVSLSADGSNLGLFRFLGKGSLVEGLAVEGTVAPEGSRLNIGGIAGTNEGTILNCRFEGSLSGVDRIGGIAGVNTLSGSIIRCQMKGSVSADHFAGGIAGENKGIIRNCLNLAEVNTAVRDPAVSVESISIETLTGSEDRNTVTDIGGIAGTSVGVIRNCINRGQVGYPHIGYNIGGIAGSQVGYIDSCQNYGKICGRKEVGGIVGQFEPISEIKYKVDTLQILQKQLAGASSLLNKAAYNAQGNMGAIGGALGSMWEDSEEAREALDQLISGDPTDHDNWVAAQNALKNSIHAMNTTMSNIGEAANATAGQLSQDLRAVSSQMGAMSKTIRDANEHMGVRLSDVSDQDTEGNHSGKVSNCENLAHIMGDLNAGGIAGSMAYENDLDPEDDLKVAGDRSLNFEGSLRAVVLNCRNSGTVSVKRLHAGGIAGWMSLGMAKNCVNTGKLDGEKAKFVGGIAGSSRGYLRSCSAKCELTGESSIGGIAGSGTIATDCLSMVSIQNGKEKLGAVLGIQEPPQDEEIQVPVSGNVYMCLEKDPGAIDGVSYKGLAEPMPAYRFVKLPQLPDAFRTSTLLFQKEDGSHSRRLILPLGTVLREENLPRVPKEAGFEGSWDGAEDLINQKIYFDRTFVPLYVPHHITVASSQLRANGRPVLLAEGSFPDLEVLPLKAMEKPQLQGKQVLEAWTLPGFPAENMTAFHLLQPDHTDIQQLQILVQKKDGVFKEAETRIDGSYLVFSADPEVTGFCVAVLPDYTKTFYIFGGAAALAVLLLCRRLYKKIKAKKKPRKS